MQQLPRDKEGFTYGSFILQVAHEMDRCGLGDTPIGDVVIVIHALLADQGLLDRPLPDMKALARSAGPAPGNN